MSMPFYVSPEQLMKDKADYARKGIARGRSVVVLQYDRGIVFVAENPQSLRKISEIYDRIAFAAVGMYYEFESLRVAGIRYADLRGYSYDRSDVSARGLANAYAQTLGTVFTQEPKPYEIELCVAEVGDTPEGDQIFRLTYDGSVADQHGFLVMGGASGPAEERLKRDWQEGMPLGDALVLAVSALGADPAGGADRSLAPDQLEVAVLDRHRPRRTFRRIIGPLLADLINADSPTAHAPELDDGAPGHHDTLSGEHPSAEAQA
ncbi:MAG: proteasome subunit alpha [Candidatus Phosphoribacter sp.]|nr:proteasome subunit alpha [Actinomycetales bacterium]